MWEIIVKIPFEWQTIHRKVTERGWKELKKKKKLFFCPFYSQSVVLINIIYFYSSWLGHIIREGLSSSLLERMVHLTVWKLLKENHWRTLRGGIQILCKRRINVTKARIIILHQCLCQIVSELNHDREYLLFMSLSECRMLSFILPVCGCVSIN